jgi:hypothetical protein
MPNQKELIECLAEIRRDRHLPPATHGHRPPLDEETDDEL